MSTAEGGDGLTRMEWWGKVFVRSQLRKHIQSSYPTQPPAPCSNRPECTVPGIFVSNRVDKVPGGVVVWRHKK